MEREQTPEQQAKLQQTIYNTMQHQAKMEAQYQDMVKQYRKPKTDTIWSYILVIILTIIIVKRMDYLKTKRKTSDKWNKEIH